MKRNFAMKIAGKYFRCQFIFLALFSFSLGASLNDYIYPHSLLPSYSNSGTIGVIQNPNARLLPKGSLGFTWSDVDPYKRGSIVAYPFSWMEVSYQYTDVDNALYSDIPSFSGNQSYKDKSFDAKFLLLKERRLTPALAIGARDFAGTGVFSSEFLVASKRIGNMDLSLGLGWGTLSGNSIRNPLISLDDRFKFRSNKDDTQGGELNTESYFRGDAGIFAGAEIFLPNIKGLRLKVEYDGTNYEKEGFPFGRKSFKYAFSDVRQSSSPYNFGILYPYSDNVHFKLNYVKGHTLSFGFSIQLHLQKKNPLIKKNDNYKDIKNYQIIRKLNTNNDRYLYLTTLQNMKENKLYLQNLNINETEMDLVYTQSTHNSFIRSAGRTLRILDQLSPPDIKYFTVSNINAGMGMHSIKIPRDSFSSHIDNQFAELVKRDIKIDSYKYNSSDYEYTPKSIFPTAYWKITPDIRSQIGGPDGFYFGDIRIRLNSEILFKKNISLISSASVGIYDNFDSLKLASDSVIPHVRTEIVNYLKESKRKAINRLQLNYFGSFGNNIYYKFTGGLMEEMFGGFGGEILYRPFNQNFGIGAEIWRVKQRGYDQMFDFLDYETTTGHINLYYKEPKSKVLISLKGGKFLAQDSGINFDFSRRFKSGFRVGAFFSLTDISKQEFGEGSFDKGFYFHVPVDIFFDKYSKGNFSWGLKPITRDGAAYLIHAFHLWGVTEQAQLNNLNRDLDDIYD